MFNTAWRPLSENLRRAQRRRPARESTPAARPECASRTTSSSTATVGCPPGTRRRPPRPRRVVRSPAEPIRLGRRDRLLADAPAGPPVAGRCGKRGQQVRKWQAQPVAGAPSAPAAPTAKGGDADDTVGVLTPVTANPAAAAPSASSLSGSLEVTPGITVDRVVINRLSDNAMNIVFNRAGTARLVDVGGRRRGEPTTARSGSASPPRRPVELRRDVGRDVLVACGMHSSSLTTWSRGRRSARSWQQLTVGRSSRRRRQRPALRGPGQASPPAGAARRRRGDVGQGRPESRRRRRRPRLSPASGWGCDQVLSVDLADPDVAAGPRTAHRGLVEPEAGCCPAPGHHVQLSSVHERTDPSARCRSGPLSCAPGSSSAWRTPTMT